MPPLFWRARRDSNSQPRLRRPVLYPVELRARVESLRQKSCSVSTGPANYEFWSGRWDSNSRPSAPKADALPGCATPRGRAHYRRRGSLRSIVAAGFYHWRRLAPPCISDRKAAFPNGRSPKDPEKWLKTCSTTFHALRSEEGRGIHELKQLTHFRKILQTLKQELSEDIERTVHTMQDEATVFADPNDRASQKPTWRSNCATAIANAS